MGNFVMGLAAGAKACTPCALSSALLMDGCRPFDFKRNPPLKFPRGNWPSRDGNTKPAVFWIGGLLHDGAWMNQNSAGREAVIFRPMQISTSVGVDQCIRVSVRFMFSNLNCMTPERKTRRPIYGRDLNHAHHLAFYTLLLPAQQEHPQLV